MTTKAEFFEKVQSIIEDVLMSAQGIHEMAGLEYTERDAAIDIVCLVPEYVWSDAPPGKEEK